MMRIRTVKPQIILIACLVIIHYLSALKQPTYTEYAIECPYIHICMCACMHKCECVSGPAKLAVRQTHTRKPLFT